MCVIRHIYTYLYVYICVTRHTYTYLYMHICHMCVTRRKCRHMCVTHRITQIYDKSHNTCDEESYHTYNESYYTHVKSRITRMTSRI